VTPHRVLYAHHVGRIAGAERSLLLLFRHLDRSRVTPLLATPPGSPFADAARAQGVEVLPVAFAPLRRAGGVAGAARAIRRLIRDRDLHVVHANGPQSNVPAALAARSAGVPVVWHARNLVYAGLRDVDRWLAPLATRIVCNADAIRERFRGSRAWRRSLTILNAIDTAEFHPGVAAAPLAAELALPPGTPLVGIVGRIGLGKGHEYFVEAAIRLLATGVDACFVVVGDTGAPEDATRVESLLRLVKDAGREDRIRFTGHRRDVPAVIRALDVLVLASDAEPCGRVLFEAAASGVPVVATASGGTPEIVRDGREALLVPPRDARALGEAVGRLLADGALRAALGANGAARARDVFDVRHQIPKFLALYDELCAHA
jgi:glycosyltransferase involved in cell wall biosynthesis